MAHITLPKELPGIVAPLTAYPETGKVLRTLAQTLLRGPSSLTPGERELIATYVSFRNECMFCTESHAAATRAIPDKAATLVDAVLQRGPEAAGSKKLEALLRIADLVRKDGRQVNEKAIQEARSAGADDKAIHDTVLIAAAFCMFNRYVEGLGTWAPPTKEAYVEMGKALATHGYTE